MKIFCLVLYLIFFFFDGEKIAKLAVEETSEQMKESIKAMLGITVLDVLQGDIGKIINKISKNIAGNQDLKKLEELRSVKETAEQVLEEADVEIEGAKLKLEELQLELEQLNTEYSVKGGGILEQKNALMKQRSESIAAVNSSQEQLLEIAGGELPLLLVSDLLKDIGTQGKAEQEKKLNKVALEKVNVLYERFAGKSEDVAKFISFMMTEINSDKSEELYNLSDYNLYQIELLNADKLKRCALHTQELVAKKR